MGFLGGFTGTHALEDAGSVIQQIALPLAHHDWVDLEVGRDLRHGLFPLEGGKGCLGFELTAVLSTFPAHDQALLIGLIKLSAWSEFWGPLQSVLVK